MFKSMGIGAHIALELGVYAVLVVAITFLFYLQLSEAKAEIQSMVKIYISEAATVDYRKQSDAVNYMEVKR